MSERFEGMTGDEMLDHPQNADLKAVVEKRTLYNRCINAYAKLLTLVGPHLQTQNMTGAQRESYIEILKELRKCHCDMDPGMEELLDNFPENGSTQ